MVVGAVSGVGSTAATGLAVMRGAATTFDAGLFPTGSLGGVGVGTGAGVGEGAVAGVGEGAGEGVGEGIGTGEGVTAGGTGATSVGLLSFLLFSSSSLIRTVAVAESN